MYKIYFEPHKICIANNLPSSPGHHFIDLDHHEKNSGVILNNWLNDPKHQDLLFVSSDPEKAFLEISQYYKTIEAAGGLVMNPEHKMLMIYRLGKWDLPKGKIDQDETARQTAIREVEEECGIGRLTISGNLPPTYHIYQDKDMQWILKKTHWFRMHSSKWKNPVPQTEEHIIKVKWARQDEIKKMMKNSYRSIADLLSSALNADICN